MHGPALGKIYGPLEGERVFSMHFKCSFQKCYFQKCLGQRSRSGGGSFSFFRMTHRWWGCLVKDNGGINRLFGLPSVKPPRGRWNSAKDGHWQFSTAHDGHEKATTVTSHALVKKCLIDSLVNYFSSWGCRQKTTRKKVKLDWRVNNRQIHAVNAKSMVTFHWTGCCA